MIESSLHSAPVQIEGVEAINTPGQVGLQANREFKAPMSALDRTVDAQTNLQQQFDQHKYKAAVAKMKFAARGDMSDTHPILRSMRENPRTLKGR